MTRAQRLYRAAGRNPGGVRCQHALAECKAVMAAKQIADVAEAARVYLERTNASVETVNRAAEIRTLAERQMGAFLKQMPKNQGGDPVPHRNRVDEPATLAEIGITKKQSATAQKLADIPEPEFRERIAVAKASGETPTPGGAGIRARCARSEVKIRLWPDC